jgi:hypothetical protein
MTNELTATTSMVSINWNVSTVERQFLIKAVLTGFIDKSRGNELNGSRVSIGCVQAPL